MERSGHYPFDAGDPGDITRLLRRMADGDKSAEQLLFERIYGELRALAARRLNHERRGHTLQPTALVNEAYLRMTQHRIDDIKNRVHFMILAARAMRRILADYGRARRADKRFAFSQAIPLEPWHSASETSESVSDLDEALDRFSKLDPDAAMALEMHYFGGLTYEEIGVQLKCSSRTAKRMWERARAWLHADLHKD